MKGQTCVSALFVFITSFVRQAVQGKKWFAFSRMKIEGEGLRGKMG